MPAYASLATLDALRRWFSDFVLGTDDDGELCITLVLTADAAAQLFAEMGTGRVAADASQFSIVATPPWEEPDGRVIGYDDDPEIAGQQIGEGRWTISVAAKTLTAETSDQPDRQPPSRLPHNTRPGS